MRPRSVPSRIARCTCSTPRTSRNRQHSTSTSPYIEAASTAAPLDFLYPSFGFFSRTLPETQPVASTSKSTLNFSAGTPFLRRNSAKSNSNLNIARNGSNALLSNGRSLSNQPQRCACGRNMFSCTHCRPASTSAAARVAPNATESDQDEISTLPDTTTNLSAHKDTKSYTIPDPTLTPQRPPPNAPSQSAPSSLPADLAKLVKFYKSFTDVDLRPTPPKLGSSKRHKELKQTSEETMERLDQLWVRVQSLLEKGKFSIETEFLDQLDLVKAFSKLARSISTLNSDPIHETSNRQQVAAIRNIAGQRMQQILQQINPAHDAAQSRDLARLKIDALALQNKLPPISFEAPSLDADEQHSPATSALYQLFIPSHNDSNFQPDRQILLILLQAWNSTEEGAEQAVNFMCGWRVGNFLLENLTEQNPKTAGFNNVVRRRYGQLLQKLVPSPSAWFEQSSTTHLEEREIGPHLIRFLATSGSALEALQIWHNLQSNKFVRSQGISLRNELVTLSDLLEGLIQSGLLQDGNLISRKVESLAQTFLDRPDFRQTADSALRNDVTRGLRLVARLGSLRADEQLTQSALGKLKWLGWQGGLEPEARLLRVASKSNSHREIELIRVRALEKSATPQDRARLTGSHVQALLRFNQLEQAVTAVEDLISRGEIPTLQTINQILHGYAARHDVDGVYALFQRLAAGEFKVQPNVDSYHALLVAHSHARDLHSVFTVFSQMKQTGISPNLRVWTTIMNLHVELGQWKQALRVYEYLLTNPHAPGKPDTAALNILLKAAVLTATPARTILIFFRRALEQGLRPNLSTYTLVMQSICSAGLMQLAEELFRLMDRNETGNEETRNLPQSMRGTRPDVFIFSCMLSGYLKQGLTLKARNCLFEMRQREIFPSSVTYGIIFSAMEDEFDDTRELSEFIESFLSQHTPLTGSTNTQLRPARFDRALLRKDELINIFAPILQKRAKAGRAQSTLNVFKMILAAGGKPSVELYTILMDSYRRSQGDSHQRAEDVLTVWNGLQKSILDAYAQPVTEQSGESNKDNRPVTSESSLKVSPAHSNALLLPLTILIDTLDQDTKVRRTGKIRKIWSTLARQGFGFDASNWNTLAQHFCRTTQLRRAMWVIENVLCDETATSRSDFGGKGTENSARNAFGLFPFQVEGAQSLTVPRPRTPNRISHRRQAERDLQRKSAGSIQTLLTEPIDLTQISNSAAAAEPSLELMTQIEKNAKIQRKHYWFAYHATLKLIASLLREQELEHRERGNLADWQEVMKNHPKLTKALQQWESNLSMTQRDSSFRSRRSPNDQKLEVEL